MRQIFYLAIICMFQVSTSYASPDEYLEGIKIVIDSKNNPQIEYTLSFKKDGKPKEYSFPDVYSYTLDTGGYDVDRLINLIPCKESNHDFIVEQQYETSCVILSEDGSMPLVNWKHFISTWKQLAEPESNIFLSILNKSQEFPKIDQKNIFDAALSESKRIEADLEKKCKGREQCIKSIRNRTKWLVSLAKTCDGPNSPPCFVTITKTIFRVKAKIDNEYRVICKIEMKHSIGC